MTAQDLKNAILQLAVQGKLVEQRPDEGTAQDLYRQIQKEKQALIMAGKVKKEKPLSEITEDEKPFDIPENWMWCHAGDLFQHNTGKALNASNKSGITMTYITTSNLYWDRFELDNLKEMPFTEAEVEKCTVKKGDLLVCEGGDYGRSAIWPHDYPMRIQNHIHRLRAYGPLSIRYFYYVFYLYKNTGLIAGKGIAIQGLSSNALHTLKTPLPPLAEQQRIVAKIEELMPLVEEYGKAEERLSVLNSAFPDKLRKSILQQAIKGKLTERDPADEPASELLKRIRAEKEQLIKEDKIKKEKPLPPITEEEKPFEVPDSWVWVRFSSIINYISTGPFGSMLHKSDYVSNGIPLINPANIVGEHIVPSERMMVSKETTERLSSYRLQKGTIVMGRRGEMGRCAVVTDNEEGWLCGTGSFFMEPSSLMCCDYIIKFFATVYAKHYLGGESVGSTMNNLNHTILSKMSMPLPPLAEQKRIVDRVNEFLAVCNELK